MDLIDRILQDLSRGQEATGRISVTLSYAQSLDGSISMQRGSPFALSSAPTSRLTHQLRASHDAILVGVGTVLADNPRLTARLVGGPNPQPVILDSRLSTPLDCKLMHGPRLPWIMTTERADPAKAARLEAAGARLFYVQATAQGRVAIAALLELLSGQGLSSLMVEGGARVITAFLSEKLADGLVLTCAPVILGGLPAVETAMVSVEEMHGSAATTLLPQLEATHAEQVGPDLVIWGRLVYDEWNENHQ